jgi:uncharacterized protein
MEIVTCEKISMSSIQPDQQRFREIVRGKIKQNLRKYISKGDMIGKQGKEQVTIPLPQIDIPHFRFGGKEQGGVGQGKGDVGQPIAPGDPQDGDGKGKAGEGAGEHSLEVEVTLDELAKILGEELRLPNIQPKGKKNIERSSVRYSTIRKVGPESLRHFKRTFRRALYRQIASGSYNPNQPYIVPVRDDKRYRAGQVVTRPEANAIIIYIMDVSGSMGDEQKEIVRIESFWLDTWLKSQYKGLETRFIIHDAVAREVNREVFFKTRESGGTMISSAYKLCAKIIEEDYPASSWNIYPFHFSDGDNWSAEDSRLCIQILNERILPRVNQFSYGQVESPYGSGQFIKDLKENFAKDERVSTSEIKDKDSIIDSIKDFLGRGR